MDILDTGAINRRKKQENSFPVESEVQKRREFSDREVGLTHPDLSSFIRLNDQGDIEIFASPGVGIVISGRSKSISLFGDQIRMHCNEDGLRWNNYNFNYSSSDYSEPTLVKLNYKNIHSAQNGISYYLDRMNDLEDQENQKTITISGDYGFNEEQIIPQQTYTSEDNLSDLTFEQIGLLEAYSSNYSKEHIDLMVKYIREGLTFDQAHLRALREMNE
jgi:hypothetical protein